MRASTIHATRESGGEMQGISGTARGPHAVIHPSSPLQCAKIPVHTPNHSSHLLHQWVLHSKYRDQPSCNGTEHCGDQTGNKMVREEARPEQHEGRHDA